VGARFGLRWPLGCFGAWTFGLAGLGFEVGLARVFLGLGCWAGCGGLGLLWFSLLQLWALVLFGLCGLVWGLLFVAVCVVCVLLDFFACLLALLLASFALLAWLGLLASLSSLLLLFFFLTLFFSYLDFVHLGLLAFVVGLLDLLGFGDRGDDGMHDGRAMCNVVGLG